MNRIEGILSPDQPTIPRLIFRNALSAGAGVFSGSVMFAAATMYDIDYIKSVVEAIGIINSSGVSPTFSMIEVLKGIGGIATVLPLTAGACSVAFGVTSLRDIPYKVEDLKIKQGAEERRLKLFHPEWVENPPSEKELEKFEKATSYLPPIGGKIGIEGKHPKPLTPTLTAEEQVDIILRRRPKLGKAYIHQLTVQGRLGDDFKHVAVGLLINSPYKHNWEEPFFDSPWGKVAPLVHDGGNFQLINGYWNKKGRTDFLQRVVRVWEPDLERIEGLSVPDVLSLPKEKLDRARLEQLERGRLLLEAKAYQRLALAFTVDSGYGGYPPIHTLLGTSNSARLGAIAESFRHEMTNILGEFNVASVVKVNWFRRRPRNQFPGNEDDFIGRAVYGDRYEADWEPIKVQLQSLEEARWKHPELRKAVNGLLQAKTQEVDQIIGLA